MDEIAMLEALARAKGDQVASGLRDSLPRLQQIARADQSTWTDDDVLLIRYALLGVAGFIHEGRL